MLLDLTKSLSFFATLLSLYPVVVNAFFLPPPAGKTASSSRFPN